VIEKNGSDEIHSLDVPDLWLVIRKSDENSFEAFFDLLALKVRHMLEGPF
jgi:hypothetical protein